jgi:hypothetical protein
LPEGLADATVAGPNRYSVCDAQLMPSTSLPYERVGEAGVIVSQAVHVAVGIDRCQILGVGLANRASRSS